MEIARASQLDRTRLSINYDGMLGEWVDRNRRRQISYAFDRIGGIDHFPLLTCTLTIKRATVGSDTYNGLGNSKKKAKAE
ncbi:hypothetical protein JCM8547_006733 [Rhodosporidiobolus lusitaniae]